jgi:hypothetical protein
MNRILPVEIRFFYSLSELNSFIDRGISWYSGFLEEYNQRLGDILRDQKGANSEELLKKLQEKGLTPPKQQQKKKGKGKGKGDKETGDTASEGWFSFKGLLFSAEKQGKAEIFFEAVERIKKALERLKETKAIVEELQKSSFDSDMTFSAYLVEGLPEKIFVEPAVGISPKYKFEMIFSTGPEGIKISEKPVEKAVEPAAPAAPAAAPTEDKEAKEAVAEKKAESPPVAKEADGVKQVA